MLPVKTEETPHVYKGDGKDVVDLPCAILANQETREQVAVVSYWRPEGTELEALAHGAPIRLVVSTPYAFPPVSLDVDETQTVVE